MTSLPHFKSDESYFQVRCTIAIQKLVVFVKMKNFVEVVSKFFRWPLLQTHPKNLQQTPQL